MDQTPKNILNSSQFQTPLPLGPLRQLPQRPLLVKHSEEEVLQSFKIKKNVLLQALQSKKQGSLKDYYQIINKQGFVNAKEEPQALRIWVKVFLETITNIIHEYQDHELLELLVFKLPWFTSTTTHGQNFNCFMRLCLAVFPHDVSYIHKVIKHIFSPHGLFQCIMLREHRPTLADLLWDRALQIIKSFEEASSVTLAEGEEEKTQAASFKFTEVQIQEIQYSFRVIKTAEDIQSKAKSILRRHTDQNQDAVIKIQNLADEIYLKTLFSFHPTRDLPEDPKYPILIGKCYGYPTYFVQTFKLKDCNSPDEDDAISIKKCLNGVVQEQAMRTKSYAESKYQNSVLKKLSFFLVKIINLYPFAYQFVIQNLTEKIPHKSMQSENQYLYYKMILDVAKCCPESQEKILESVVEKLCQLDVDIKTKIRKFQFSSLKQIQPMNSYMKELSVKIPTDKETKMGIMLDLVLEYIQDRIKQMSLNKEQKVNNFDEFIETLMKIFENKIFPIHKLNFMQYIPLFIITQSQKHEGCKIFAEKFLSFLIYKAFNENGKEHLSTRQQGWNYLASFLSRENQIIPEATFMKALNFIVNRYNQNFKLKALKRSPSIISQSSTDASSEPIEINESTSSQERIFLHCFIQGLALIIATKNDKIIKNDPQMFNKLCKIVFKKYFNNLTFCSPLILSDLLRLTDSNKHGLYIFKQQLRTLFRRQQEELKNSKRQIYNKVSKFMAYEVPLHIYPVNERFQESMIYEDTNSPVIQTPPEKEVNTDMEENVSMMTSEEQLKYTVRNEEIDFSSSNDEERKRNAQNIFDNSIVLYVPDSSNKKMVVDEEAEMGYSQSKASEAISLAQAIAQSRNNEKIRQSMNVHFADQQNILEERVQVYSQINSNPFSKLNQQTLTALNGGHESTVAQSEDFEGISSSRDTEYSVSPQIHFKKVHIAPLVLLSDKSKKNRSIERTKRTITLNLKEENDRADLQLRLKNNQA